MSGEVGRSAQITMFFIIGIVLLFTVAIFYLMFGSSDESPQYSGDQLNSYIGSCVDTIVESKLAELGKAGGIWDDEASYTFGTVGEKKVLYGITANTLEGDGMLPYAYATPQYPDWGVKLQDTAMLLDDGDLVPMYPIQPGYFGDVNFPAICERGTCAHHLGVLGVYGVGSPEVSVEERLEKEITTSLDQCINAGRFEQHLGRAVTQSSRPVVNVTFTQQAVLVSIQYALIIDGEAKKATYEPRYSVRYLAIAQYAVDLAREETRNISFNMTRDYRKITSYREGFTVTRTPNAVTSPLKADLITITDEQSGVRGDRFSLRFLVQHRPPMLEWITKDQAVNCPAIDPDDGPVTCGWAGDNLFFVNDGDNERDCIRFDALTNEPERSSYDCW